MPSGGGSVSAAVRRILVIAEGGMGDTILAVPVLRALRAAMPNAHVTFNCGRAWTPLFARCPYLDRIKTAPRQPGQWPNRFRRLWATFLFGLALRGRFDLVLVLYPATRQLHFVAWLSGARRRVSYDRGRPTFLLTTSIPNVGSARELNLGLLARLGLPTTDQQLELWDPPEARSRVEQLLASAGVRPQQTVLGLHPGSDWSCQQWQPAKWAALADMLARVYTASIVLTGSEADRPFLDQIRALARTEPIDLGGRTTLAELVSLTRRLDLLVSVDSGPAPIAVAVDTPVVVLVGEYPPDWTVAGRQEAVRVIRRGDDGVGEDVRQCRDMHYGVERCVSPWCLTRGRMDLIGVGDVLGAVHELYRARVASATGVPQPGLDAGVA